VLTYTQNVKTLPDYGKSLKYPPHPSVLDRFVQLLKLIHNNWRAKMMIMALAPAQRLIVRRKVKTSGVFRGTATHPPTATAEADKHTHTHTHTHAHMCTCAHSPSLFALSVCVCPTAAVNQRIVATL
jgi:hypothetical protein